MTAKKSQDVEKLQEVIEAMDGLSQAMCSEIYCLARLALAALETPSGHSNTDVVAEAFNSIKRRIEYDGDAIMCQASAVGCAYENPQEALRLVRRMDAWRAELYRHMNDDPVDLPGFDKAVANGS